MSNKLASRLRLSSAVAFVLAGSLLTGVMRAEIIEQVLVKVNGEIFTKTELEARQVAALRQLGEQNPSDQQLRKMLDEITPQLIVSVVDEMLIVQRGMELGYRMDDAQFQSILENLKKDNKIETEEMFQAALKQEGLTMEELRRNLERQMIVSRVQQNEVLGRVGVSEDEARRYYDANLKEFTTTPTVTLREILVAVPSAGSVPNAEEAAKAKAEQIRRRALAGESFEKLAADLSDAPSRANAGLIGPLNLSDVSAELQTIIETMKVGDVSEVLRSAAGYQMLKLESATPPEATPFEQAREEISNRVFTDKRRTEFNKYMEKLRSEAIIEWKNEDMKKAFDLGVEQTKSGASVPQGFGG